MKFVSMILLAIATVLGVVYAGPVGMPNEVLADPKSTSHMPRLPFSGTRTFTITEPSTTIVATVTGPPTPIETSHGAWTKSGEGTDWNDQTSTTIVDSTVVVKTTVFPNSALTKANAKETAISADVGLPPPKATKRPSDITIIKETDTFTVSNAYETYTSTATEWVVSYSELPITSPVPIPSFETSYYTVTIAEKSTTATLTFPEIIVPRPTTFETSMKPVVTATYGPDEHNDALKSSSHKVFSHSHSISVAPISEQTTWKPTPALVTFTETGKSFTTTVTLPYPFVPQQPPSGWKPTFTRASVRATLPNATTVTASSHHIPNIPTPVPDAISSPYNSLYTKRQIAPELSPISGLPLVAQTVTEVCEPTVVSVAGVAVSEVVCVVP